MDASTTYFKYLKYLNTKHKINALEIGTGSGLFLVFKKLGFPVMGLNHPNKQFISKKKFEKNIINGMLEETKIRRIF